MSFCHNPSAPNHVHPLRSQLCRDAPAFQIEECSIVETSVCVLCIIRSQFCPSAVEKQIRGATHGLLLRVGGPHPGSRCVKKVANLVLENNVPGFVSLFRRRLKSDDVQSVNDTRNVTQDGQQDVDEEISIAASLKEDT